MGGGRGVSDWCQGPVGGQPEQAPPTWRNCSADPEVNKNKISPHVAHI